MATTTNDIEPTASRRYWDGNLICDSASHLSTHSERMLWSCANTDRRKEDRFPMNDCFRMEDDFFGSELSEFWVQRGDVSLSDGGIGGVVWLRCSESDSHLAALTSRSKNVSMLAGFRFKCRLKVQLNNNSDTRGAAVRFEFGLVSGNHRIDGDEVKLIFGCVGSDCYCESTSLFTNEKTLVVEKETAVQQQQKRPKWSTYEITTDAKQNVCYYIDNRLVAMHQVGDRFYEHLFAQSFQLFPTVLEPDAWCQLDYVQTTGGRQEVEYFFDGTANRI